MNVDKKDPTDFAAALSSDKSVSEALTGKIASIGENIIIRRGVKFTAGENELVASYVHSAVCDGMGKIGVLVLLKFNAGADKNAMAILSKNLAMHIAASKPKFLRKDPSAQDGEALLSQIYIMDGRRAVGEVLKDEQVEIKDFALFVLGDSAKAGE